MPKVAVSPTKFAKAADSLDPDRAAESGVANLKVVDLDEALATKWTTDAHMVCYQVVDAEGTPLRTWPRILKSLLGPLRDAGADVRVACFLVDYDNPDHKEWTFDLAQDFVGSVAEACAEEPLLASYSCFYATQHGGRFVYSLDTPLSPEDAEAHHRGLVDLWRRNGVPVDTACSDWTRMFRLPFVTRDGTPTWSTPPLLDYEVKSATLDASALPRVDAGQARNKYAEIIRVTDLKPDPDEAFSIMWDRKGASSRAVQTDFHKLAKKRLAGRDCFDCVFNEAPLASPGKRTDTLMRYVGSAAGMLYGLPGVTPASIYSLFLPAVEQLEPDDGTPDWTEDLWRQVCRYWEGEDAQYRARVKDAEDADARSLSVQQEMLAGMREWAPDCREIRGDDREAFEFLLRHMVAVTSSGYCAVMRPDGYFDRVHVKRDHLRIRFRYWGLEDVLPLTTIGGNGRERPMSGAEILDKFGFMVSSVEGITCSKGSFIEDLGKESPKLMVRLYGRRTDLEPRFDRDVDQWLKLFFGDAYPVATRWIGHALAFDEGPIAALSYKGEPGAGKKMLVMGLAETIDTGMTVSGGAFAQFNAEVLKSPFVVINEGWERNTGNRDRADTFRHLVSGDAILIEEKFQSKIVGRTPLRVVMTANNNDVVSEVFSHRDMSAADRAALITRILHIEADGKAAHWLRMKGGKAFTGRKGARWVRGDAGQPSDHIVARHYLWLYENRGVVEQGSRLLVEGKVPDYMVRAMATRSGTSPILVETVVAMVENGRWCGMLKDMSRGRAHTTTKAVIDYFRDHFADKSIGKGKLNIQTVGKVLDGFVHAASPRDPTIMETPAGNMRARWRELDLRMLLREAHDHGYPCKTLEKMVESHDRYMDESIAI